jgi:dihydrofolate synthase/folylpolyglutamate synthase
MANCDPTDYTAVTEYLFGLKAHGPKFGIDRMTRLAAAIGHPERALPLVHVAGTNGKGSVAAMLDAILHAANWRTGLYTSPHLVKMGERVQVERRKLTENEICAYVRELRPLAERIGADHPEDHPSFFEFMTAMALLQFARRRCEIGVIEVGMGGRLDATNIITPEVSVITSISLDHCEFLGDTYEQIATEKAGIIKPGRPVVIGRMPEAAERVIRARAEAADATVLSVVAEFGDNLDRYPHSNLEGDYQRWNAATATLAARALPAKWQITAAVIAAGLYHVDWPGRWQRVRLDGRLLVLDASHNPEGAAVLAVNLQHLCEETGRRPVVITGVLGAARARPLVETVCRFAREVHFVVPQQPRACTHAELEALMPAGYAGRCMRSEVARLFPAAGGCTAGGPEDVLVVTGSIYLLGEVMACLEPQRGNGAGRLQDF